MAKKPTTVTKLWEIREEEWTKITAAQSDKLVMAADVLKSFKAKASTRPTFFSDSCNLPKF